MRQVFRPEQRPLAFRETEPKVSLLLQPILARVYERIGSGCSKEEITNYGRTMNIIGHDRK